MAVASTGVEPSIERQFVPNLFQDAGFKLRVLQDKGLQDTVHTTSLRSDHWPG